MQLGTFLTSRRSAWDELTELVERAGGRPERLGAAGVVRLGLLYREVAADLALARRLYPGESVTNRLEALTQRTRPLVYAAPPRKASFVDFVSREFWWQVRRQPIALLVAGALLLVPALAIGWWADANLEEAVELLPGQFANAGDTRSDEGDLGLGTAQQLAFSTSIFTNNVRVALLAFAGGMTFGLLTAAALVFNGLLFGLLTGVSVAVGNTGRFVELVAPHGVLELSLIIVAGAAGLRFGWAVVDPGFRPRSEAIAFEGRAAVELVLGTSVWLVVAGLIEGFVTPRGVGTWPAVIIGVGAALAFWVPVFLLGRPPAPDNADVPV